MCLLYGGISMVSIYGNSLVIWVVSTTKTMQTVHNGLIANLACSDIVIAIFCIPFQFYAALLQVIYFHKIYFSIFNGILIIKVS